MNVISLWLYNYTQNWNLKTTCKTGSLITAICAANESNNIYFIHIKTKIDTYSWLNNKIINILTTKNYFKD